VGEDVNNPNKLVRKKYNFPVNPVLGYIDGSVYLFSAHHPVDVIGIEFGDVVSGRMVVTLETSWVLEFEMSGFKNFTHKVVTYIEL